MNTFASARRVLLVCCFACWQFQPAGVLGDSIVIESGKYEILSRNNCISGELQRALVIQGLGVWGVIPGTSWLQADASSQHSTCTLYQAVFNLPEGYRSPKLSVQVYVDDFTSIFLNGNQVGSTRGFEGPPRMATSTTPGSPWRIRVSRRSL